MLDDHKLNPMWLNWELYSCDYLWRITNYLYFCYFHSIGAQLFWRFWISSYIGVYWSLLFKLIQGFSKSIHIVCWKLMYNLKTFHLHHWQAHPMLSNYLHIIWLICFSSIIVQYVIRLFHLVVEITWNGLDMYQIRCFVQRIKCLTKCYINKLLLCAFGFTFI